MRYYKLIIDRNMIGVGTSLDCRRYQCKHNILLCCDETLAEYISVGDALYRDGWMSPCVTDDIPYTQATVIEITEDEYNTLHDAIETGKTIEAESTQEEPEQPVIDPNEEITIEALRILKEKEMDYIARKTIESGFDIALSDGEIHHFSLTTQDQLNLITLSTIVASGETQVPYHADGEMCRFYSADDIRAIVAEATAYTTYHTTYVNALNHYIKALNDMAALSELRYGDILPEEYRSDVLNYIMENN